MRLRTVLLATLLLLLIGGCEDRVVVTRRATIGNQPTTAVSVDAGSTWQHHFEIVGGVVGFSYTWQVEAIGSLPHGAFDIDSLGAFRFHTTVADANQGFNFRVLLTDCRGRTDRCDFTVSVTAPRPLVVRIESALGLPGHHQYVSLIKESGPEEFGGFDLVIGWDAFALALVSAEPGIDIGSTSCGWEYFSYRYSNLKGENGPYSIGTLRIIALADQNDGPRHPLCRTVPDNGELARLRFMISDNPAYECHYLPIRFLWTSDLLDNTFSTPSGDSVYVVSRVFDWTLNGYPANSVGELTGTDCDSNWGFHYGGHCRPYESEPGLSRIPIPEVIFCNGGVNLDCSPEIELRGDLNLNGVACEVADLRLYAEYFLHGIGVFPRDPGLLSGVTKTSDVNGDGLPFTVADYMYLIRVMSGDPLPSSQLHPLTDQISVTLNRGVVSVESSVTLGGFWFTFAVVGEYRIGGLPPMGLAHADSVGTLTVLVPPAQRRSLTTRLSPGEHDLFRVSGDVTLISVQASDYDGNLLKVSY